MKKLLLHTSLVCSI